MYLSTSDQLEDRAHLKLLAAEGRNEWETVAIRTDLLSFPACRKEAYPKDEGKSSDSSDQKLKANQKSPRLVRSFKGLFVRFSAARYTDFSLRNSKNCKSEIQATVIPFS
ncbi:hypothetical protein Mapa_003698 [Marchantia paleacea]|nr:hypothetical protein Mapa_003698 [Marchantia paleacea]